MCKVDEIAAVRENVLCRVVNMCGGEGTVLVPDVRGEGRVGPLALGLKEESKGVGADVACILQRVVDTCRILVSVNHSSMACEEWTRSDGARDEIGW